MGNPKGKPGVGGFLSWPKIEQTPTPGLPFGFTELDLAKDSIEGKAERDRREQERITCDPGTLIGPGRSLNLEQSHPLQTGLRRIGLEN